MKFATASVIIAFATLVAGATNQIPMTSSHTGGRICGSEISPARKAAHELKFARVMKHASAKAVRHPEINVNFHVIAANQTRAGGWISDKDIAHQMKVLNHGFHSTGVRYKLVNTTRTVNKDWFTGVAPNSAFQTTMKYKLRNGGADALNVYTVGFENPSAAGLLGYSTFPADYEGLPHDDGVVIQHQTLPGGNAGKFNLGRTLTHEVGHWVGLYHTFQGLSCSSTGDMVDDTPAQKSPTTGCPKRGPDTCPGQKGKDPIHNFMDYSDDDCLHRFTTGQAKRIRSQLRTYRNINV